MSQLQPEPIPPAPEEPAPLMMAGPRSADDDERECPVCQAQMRLWAGFYRCRHCGFKESCCF